MESVRGGLIYNISCILVYVCLQNYQCVYRTISVSTELSACQQNYQCDYGTISVSTELLACRCNLAKGGLVYNTSCILLSYYETVEGHDVNLSLVEMVYIVGVVLD